MNIENSTLEDIEKELYEIKMSLIPEGLHAFGEQMGQNEYIDFVISILSYGRGDIKSITRCLAELKGYDYEDITKNYTDKKNKGIIDEIEDQSKILIRNYIKNRKITIHRYRNSKDLKKTLEFGYNAYKRASQCDELGGLVRALSGKFIKARLSGDYIRNPEVFPTGYNMYQFDPRLVPSKSALERGTKIADDTIKYYYQKYKKYPNSIAIILWGLETAKTHGETIGQIFKYIGVRPSDKGEMWNPQYEIIPLSELKRPRIDVVINICGFFRDMFPNLITDLSNIFSKISSLNEPLDMNFIKSNTLKLKRQLHEEKHKEDDIAELSSARIFGPKNGEYGTGVTEIVSTKNWNNENQLVESYLKSLRFVYTKNKYGEDCKDLINKKLKNIDIVSQVRHSNDYEVTDLDHYYEFFGCLSRSVEELKGEKAEMLISNSAGQNITIETIDKSIRRGIRARLLNPKWINGMLNHKHHGCEKIARRVENLIGLAATTHCVNSEYFSEINKKFVLNNEIREKLKENNKYGLMEIMERLFEAKERGYWTPDKDDLEKLREYYMELEGDIESYE